MSNHSRLNGSLDRIKADRSLIKTTGSNIMGNASMRVNGSSMGRIDYGIIQEAKKTVRDPYENLTVNTMIQTTAKAQYKGVCDSYPVVDTRAHLYKIHGQVDYSLNKKPKSTYLTQIMDRAKHPQFQRPSPDRYDKDKALDYATTNTNKRYAWNKEKRTSFTDEIAKREVKLKGPADYIDQRKVRIVGTYTQKEPASAFLPEVEFAASQVPASNAYKPNEKASSLNRKVAGANLNRDRSPKSMLKPTKRDDSPSPASYKDADRTWSKLSQHPTKNFAYSISKEPKKSFLDIEIKNKKAVPAAGTYKDPNYDVITRGSRASGLRKR